MEATYSGIILAGGAARRMGSDKRFLLTQGKPLVLRVLESLRPLVDEMIVATLEPELFDDVSAHVVVDAYPGHGVLAGIHAGLSAAQSDWAFVVASDMPFLNPALLHTMRLLAQSASADVIVPQWQGELEPLHALYRPSACIPAIEAALQRGERRIVAFYPDVRVHIMPQTEIAQWDPEGRSFFNVNTPEDWALTLLELKDHSSQ
ncbi:MAG: molybdenum cofactor guanylyltransferase [Anaerolineae bacterium]|nr:molybdenum cofactor guanylyltransferase [Anaerolineae bacterium]